MCVLGRLGAKWGVLTQLLSRTTAAVYLVLCVWALTIARICTSMSHI